MTPLANFPYTMPIRVTFRDLDALGHVNHATYLSYFEDIRTQWVLALRGTSRVDQLAMIVAEVTVQYRAPVLFGDTITAGTRVVSIGNKSLVMEYALHRADDDQIVATGRAVMVWYDYAAGHSTRVPDSFRAAVAAWPSQTAAESA